LLRSKEFLALAGKVTFHSSAHSPGISVPGRLNQGLEVATHPMQQKAPYKEES
jgi:hypothetical protein